MKHAQFPSTDAKPKLAFLLPDLRAGGAEHVMLSLAKEFSIRGYAPQILLANATGGLLDAARSAGIPITDLKAKRLRHIVAPLQRWLLDNNPSALVPAMWPLTSLAIWAARATAVPVITTDHATLSDQYATKGALHRLALRGSIRATYPHARANVSVSTGSARDLERLGLLSAGRVKVIHNPVAHPPIGTDVANWPNGATHRILSVGSLRWQKDFTTLLRAVRILLDQGGHDIELVILGEGPDRHELETLVQSLDLGENVSLPGHVNETGVYYASAHLFTLSSCSEGFANVIVEALSHGLPVVATDCPHGPAEILSNLPTSQLVPVKDPNRLASAIAAMLGAHHNPDASRKRATDFEPAIAADKFQMLFPEFHSSPTKE